MKHSNISEKESLELITRMIQQTQQRLQVGSGNVLLYYGYAAVFIATAVYGLCRFTEQMYWHFLWFLMFAMMVAEQLFRRQRKPEVVTYIDQAVSNVWQIISMLFCLTALTLTAIGLFTSSLRFTLLLPLALLYVGIGTSCTGIITKEKSMTYLPLPSLVISIYMLWSLSAGEPLTLAWNLLSGLAFLLMLVVPGHILNQKASQQCSKN